MPLRGAFQHSMASLVSLRRGFLPAPKSPPTAAPNPSRRSDLGDDLRHAQGEDRVALASASNAVERRPRYFRRSLIAADVISAVIALALSVQILGDDRLQLTTLAAFPIILLISKLIGLYDRDELVLEKRTIDEAPALFELHRPSAHGSGPR